MNKATVYELKQPPHSAQAEASVLGGLMIDTSAFDKVAPILSEHDFYIKRNQFIFRAITYLARRGEPADLVSVSDFLQGRGHSEMADLAYLGMLAKDTPSAANVATYARIVKEKSLLREMHGLFTQFASQALTAGDSSAKELLNEAENALFKLNQAAMKGRHDFIRLADALKAQVDIMEQLHENPPEDGVLGLSTGFAALDRQTSGLQGGDLVVIAARPSMGKTSLVMNMAETAATNGKAVAVFSMEMSAGQLAQRMLAGNAGLPLRVIREPWTIRDQGWPKLSAGNGRLHPLPLWINDSPGLRPSDLRSLCMRLQAEIRAEIPAGLGLVVVDYLQLMGFDGKPGNRSEGLGDITRALKQLAKEFNVPVLLLSQLNRDVEKRPDKRPHLADLRDSGAIEQDADVVMFVYRDEKYHEDTLDKGVAEIIFGKQRNGELGTVKLGFDGWLTRFRNL